MSGSKQNSILLVDDERANIVALTHILEPEYTVYVAKSGQEALESAARLMPDLILLDIVMPEMDGYAVLTALKGNSKTRDIPVIFITGLEDHESEKKGFSLGAADYIIKPFKPVIVKLRVKNQINLIRQMRLLLEKELEEKSSQAKLEFLLNMSHEMLTPMNIIMGMAHIAQRLENRDEIKSCLDEIETASKQLLELIHDLLNVSVDKNDKG